MIFDSTRNLYQDEHLAQLGWLDHGFGTRQSDCWLSPSEHAALNQIHSGVVVKALGQRGRLGAGDALISDMVGLMVGIRTADCAPILLADPGRRAVAAVHAGWRGTLSLIAARTVEAMAREYGTRPEDLWVAIGPSIGACCYVVGPEVAAAFRALLPELVVQVEGTHLDLVEANRRVLRRAGVRAERIHAAGLCTSCLDCKFHSYRRDGSSAGRMLSAVGVRG